MNSYSRPGFKLFTVASVIFLDRIFNVRHSVVSVGLYLITNGDHVNFSATAGRRSRFRVRRRSENFVYQMEYSVFGLTYPGTQVNVTALLLALALRLYGARGGTFITINSVSATTVAASLLAAH